MKVYLVSNIELEKIFCALCSNLLPGWKLGPTFPVHPKHLKELGVSQEVLSFPRVNIFRQLVYAWQGMFEKMVAG